MAERVTQSWTGAPHFCLVQEVDGSRLVACRERFQKQVEPPLTHSDLLVKIQGSVLKSHRFVNASWDAVRIVSHHEINIGLAVAVKDGLVVPVVHRADELGLSQTAPHRQGMKNRAQVGKLSVADLSRRTSTISILGMYGVDAFSAAVNPPQTAILAVGRIAERVVPIDDQPAVLPMTVLSLSVDHRVIDGARGAQFLEALTGFIEQPAPLLE